jgi:CSLREA domain-containing protein
MKTILNFALVAALLIAISALSASFTGFAVAGNEPLSGLAFTVDSEADTVDANPGDSYCADAGGACTLRAAVQETNAWEGADTITLPAGTYLLTIPNDLPEGEDAAASGDLDILDSLTITGTGQGTTTIQGGFDRAFHILYPNSTVQVSALTIDNAIVDGDGGAILNFGELILQDSGIKNSSSIWGEGSAIYNGGTLSMTNASIISNGDVEESYWDAITNYGEATIIGTQVIGNATYGNGGISNHGTLTLENSQIQDNYGREITGGLFQDTGSTTIKGSTIDGNSFEHGYGSIAMTGGEITIVGSTISSNWTQTGCGGVYTLAGSLTVTNSTISGNESENSGGGLCLGAGAQLANVTITDNTGDTGGLRIFLGTSDPIKLENSIITGNHGASGFPDCQAPEGRLVSLGHNLLGVLEGCESVPVETDLYGTLDNPLDRLLGPLANNGGSTLTHALLPGSSAIDAIPWCNLATDQIGTKRPQGLGCDIGAYELKQKVRSIDIKPGAFPNTINPGSTGTIPVAILSTATFNAPNKIDDALLKFGHTGWEASLNLKSGMPDCGSKDVNGDGRLDLLCRFKIQKMGFVCEDTVGILRGKTKDNQFFVGQDSVVIACP